MNEKEFLELTSAETLTVRDFENSVPENSIVFPLSDMACLGAAFGSLTTAFAGMMHAAGESKTLYEAIFPVAGRLAEKDGFKLGSIITDKGVTAQARFREVQVADTAQAAASASMVFMALAIMAINKSLQNIAEIQKATLDFLETDKQTQLKGDLIVLSDIINEYQHNWNNEQFRSNREMQILDIKRSAEQSILFYREMIQKRIKTQTFIHIDTNKTLQDIQNKFRFYKLALYLFSFSSFLDILLLENFESTYLKSVIAKINDYSEQYDVFFQSTMEKVENYTESSLQSRALQGLAIASRFAGKQIAKIPDKENRLKIDDHLIAGSSKLEQFNQSAIEKTLESFTLLEDNGIAMFIEKIHLLDRMHNHPIIVLFDKENIYLSMQENVA